MRAELIRAEIGKRSATGMVHIPGGTFRMGSGDAGEFERPVHEVQVSDFLMDAHLVTNATFASFVAATDYTSDAERKGVAWGYLKGKYCEVEGLCWRSFVQGREHHPVVLVNWNDANAFVQWAGKRLPTEAEWEFAARGGLEGTLYPWGNDVPNEMLCGFCKEPSDTPGTSVVGSYPANTFGLFDMAGNVWQWCSDWYGESYYGESCFLNPRGPKSGTLKIRRGGAWNVIQPFRLRNANRGAVRPEMAAPNIGFRCASGL